jgi:hypothetical protein
LKGVFGRSTSILFTPSPILYLLDPDCFFSPARSFHSGVDAPMLRAGLRNIGADIAKADGKVEHAGADRVAIHDGSRNDGRGLRMLAVHA